MHINYHDLYKLMGDPHIMQQYEMGSLILWII